MSTALIGYTGFVGSNLSRAVAFEDHYNSRNIEAMTGRSYDLVVCAGVQAAKWWANRNPDEDRAGIARLVDVLERVVARRFVLISTVDVYPDPAEGGDEAMPLDPAANAPYGRHRLALEQWVTNQFPGALILRLPALYGPGLKKNALYDLLNDNQVDKINPAAVFQWYDISRLWRDAEIAMAAGLKLVNLVPEPLATSAIIHQLFPNAPVGPAIHPAPRYDVRSLCTAAFGSSGHYLHDASESLHGIAAFVAAERANRQ